MDGDVVTSLLELTAVALLAVGLGVMVAAATGGLLGAGAGLAVGGVVLGAASAVLRLLARPEPPRRAR